MSKIRRILIKKAERAKLAHSLAPCGAQTTTDKLSRASRFRFAPANRNQKISFPFALKKWGAKKENEKYKDFFVSGVR